MTPRAIHSHSIRPPGLSLPIVEGCALSTTRTGKLGIEEAAAKVATCDFYPLVEVIVAAVLEGRKSQGEGESALSPTLTRLSSSAFPSIAAR